MTNWYQSHSSSAMAEVPTLDSWRDRWQKLSLESQDFHRKLFQDLNEMRISMRMPLSDFSLDVAIEIVRLPREIPKEGDVSHVDEELKCFAKEIILFDQVWSQLSLDEKISWSRVSLGLSPSFDYSIQTTGKREPEPNSTSAPMNNSGVNQSQSKDAINLNQSQGSGANKSQEMGVNQSRNAIGVNQTGIPRPSVLGTGPAEKAREFARTGPILSPIPTVSAIIKAPGMCLLPSIETLQEENGALDYTDSEQEASDEGNYVEKIEDRLEIENTHQVFDGMTPKDLLKNLDLEVTLCASNIHKEVVNSSISDPENGEQSSHWYTCFRRGIEFFSKQEFGLMDRLCFTENMSSAVAYNGMGASFDPTGIGWNNFKTISSHSLEFSSAQYMFDEMPIRRFIGRAYPNQVCKAQLHLGNSVFDPGIAEGLHYHSDCFSKQVVEQTLQNSVCLQEIDDVYLQEIMLGNAAASCTVCLEDGYVPVKEKQVFDPGGCRSEEILGIELKDAFQYFKLLSVPVFGLPNCFVQCIAYTADVFASSNGDTMQGKPHLMPFDRGKTRPLHSLVVDGVGDMQLDEFGDLSVDLGNAQKVCNCIFTLYATELALIANGEYDFVDLLTMFGDFFKSINHTSSFPFDPVE